MQLCQASGSGRYRSRARQWRWLDRFRQIHLRWLTITSALVHVHLGPRCNGRGKWLVALQQQPHVKAGIHDHLPNRGYLIGAINDGGDLADPVEHLPRGCIPRVHDRRAFQCLARPCPCVARMTEATDPAGPTYSIGAADRGMKNNGFAGARRSLCVRRHWAICMT